jgi:hypothetical protein
MRVLRLPAAVLLAGISGFLAFAGGAAISNVFGEYKDSPDAVHTGFGAGYLAVSGLFAAAALGTLSRARHPYRWLAITIAALIAGVFPYAALVGWPAYALNAALAFLAVGSAAAYLTSARPA